MSKKYLNVKQVAEMLTVHRSSIYRYVNLYKMPVSKVAGRLLFDSDKVEEWVQEHSNSSI